MISKKAYRFMTNPQERVFFDKWCEYNDTSKGMTYSTLEYILADKPNHPAGECTARDEEIAATVIQWLGSPVGQQFLNDCGFVRKEKIK